MHPVFLKKEGKYSSNDNINKQIISLGIDMKGLLGRKMKILVLDMKSFFTFSWRQKTVKANKEQIASIE